MNCYSLYRELLDLMGEIKFLNDDSKSKEYFKKLTETKKCDYINDLTYLRKDIGEYDKKKTVSLIKHHYKWHKAFILKKLPFHYKYNGI